ncbi:MAG: hypothetical protein VW127_04525 [Flavobacteriaceae bacterium]|jgi:hypothetical protein
MKPTIILLVTILFVFAGCQKSNTKNRYDNHFKLNEENHAIEKAAMIELVGNDLLNDMKVVLFASEGIRFDTDINRELQIRGQGKLMGFIIYSENPSQLDKGNHYINLRPPYEKGDVALGFYSLDWNEEDELLRYEENNGSVILAGKVSILENQELTNLSFDFTVEDGNILTGSYQGEFQKNMIYKTDHIDLEN